MYKVDMLKLLTTVALLTVTSVLDAAPLMPGEPADGGETGQNQLTVYIHAFIRNYLHCIRCIHFSSARTSWEMNSWRFTAKMIFLKSVFPVQMLRYIYLRSKMTVRSIRYSVLFAEFLFKIK